MDKQAIYLFLLFFIIVNFWPCFISVLKVFGIEAIFVIPRNSGPGLCFCGSWVLFFSQIVPFVLIIVLSGLQICFFILSNLNYMPICPIRI